MQKTPSRLVDFKVLSDCVDAYANPEEMAIAQGFGSGKRMETILTVLNECWEFYGANRHGVNGVMKCINEYNKMCSPLHDKTTVVVDNSRFEYLQSLKKEFKAGQNEREIS